MPKYTFTMTQSVELEAQETIEADNLQAAMEELARRSYAIKGTRQALNWGTGPDGDGATTLVRAIRKDGERILGIEDPMGPSSPPGWWGLNGAFDVCDLPDELRELDA